MSSPSPKLVLAFDAYGTLLSTESIATQLATHFGPSRAAAIAAKWRLYQLEYTWRLNSMARYEPFGAVTQRALAHALAEAGASLPEPDVAALMQSYDSLATFPDVAGCLAAVAAAAPDVAAVVFSNGTRAMVGSSVANSPELGPQAGVFRDIVTVDEVRRFKPDGEVYRFLCRRVGMEGREGDVWLVSGNPFDVVGARSVGLNVAWVDRLGLGWVDACVEGDKGRPTVVVKSLEEVVKAVTSHYT